MSEGASKDDRPRMVVLAGPNGSGKSTVTNGLREADSFPKLYINADDISAGELGHIADPLARNLEAAQLAEARRRQALEGKESFAFETVMSTPGKLALLDEAKTKGFAVDLVFVTTRDPGINQTRVENRVAKGGHAVAADKVRERYDRAMELLPAALHKADAGMVFDNSVDGQVPRLLVSKQDGKIEIEPGLPSWAKRMVEPIAERSVSATDLFRAAELATAGASVTHADIGGGKAYSGQVVGQTKQHMLQRLSGTTDKYVLHDRALCNGRTFEVGKATAVSYAFGADGKHIGPTPLRAKINNNRRL